MSTPKPVLVMDGWALVSKHRFALIDLPVGRAVAAYATYGAAFNEKRDDEEVIKVRIVEHVAPTPRCKRP